MGLETYAIERFRALAVIPETCQLEREIVQGKLCLLVDCPDSATADSLWRNQHQFTEPLKELALAERCIILHQGRVWHPSFGDRR